MPLTRVAKRRCHITPNKDCYQSKHDVAVASRHLEFRRGVRLYFYECACGSWHLTSRPNEES